MECGRSHAMAPGSRVAAARALACVNVRSHGSIMQGQKAPFFKKLVCFRQCVCGVCVRAKRGDGRLIQVLPRRKDKNLLPACWASGSANRREFDPGDLRQGSPGCV